MCMFRKSRSAIFNEMTPSCVPSCVPQLPVLSPHSSRSSNPLPFSCFLALGLDSRHWIFFFEYRLPSSSAQLISGDAEPFARVATRTSRPLCFLFFFLFSFFLWFVQSTGMISAAFPFDYPERLFDDQFMHPNALRMVNWY